MYTMIARAILLLSLSSVNTLETENDEAEGSECNYIVNFTLGNDFDCIEYYVLEPDEEDCFY